MDVYEFEKSLLERMEESCNVLQCKGSPVPASDVREEWACHVELKIEPAGELIPMTNSLTLYSTQIFLLDFVHRLFESKYISMSFVHLHHFAQVGKPFGK